MNNNLEAIYEVTLNGEVYKLNKSLILTTGLNALGITLDNPANFFDYDTLKETWSSSNALPTEKELISKGKQGLIEAQVGYAEKQYARDRAAAYPSIADQLDTIYHSGIDAWKLTITAVKEAHPK
jgi:hypothetical protein